MKLLRVPKKIYFKRGCAPVALREMHEVYGLQNAFLITNPVLYRKGLMKPVDKCLIDNGLHTAEFVSLIENPTIENVKAGLQKMDEFEPDLIVGVGDSKTMSAAKIMWLLYENPDVDITALAAGAKFPKLGKKAKLVLIPTTSGSGCECSPYAEIVDEKTEKQFWLSNFDLLPEMAIIDPDFTLHLSTEEIKQGGIEALRNAIAAAAVPNVNEYAQGYAREAACAIFQNMEKAVKCGAKDPVACENMANAAANAGIAYACAVQGAEIPLDNTQAIDKLVSSAADKTVLIELAKECGLTGTTEYNTQRNLIAECKKMVAL